MSNEVVELIQKAATRVEAVEAKLGEVAANQKATLDRVREIEQKAGTMPVGSGGTTRPRSALATIAADPGISAVLARKSATARITGDWSIRALKALTNDGDVNSSSGNDLYPSQAFRQPGLGNDPREELSLLSALPRLAIASATFEFVKLNGYSNAAAWQATEGNTKPETSVPTTLASVRPATVAHFLKVSEQCAADNPALMMALDNLMGYGVLQKAEEMLINGVIASDGFDGLLALGQGYTQPGQPIVDVIGSAIAAAQAAGWRPSHIVLHPITWQTIRSERTATELAYVAAGWSAPNGLQCWGLPVILSPSCPQETAIVLDARQLVIVDRQQVVVEVGRDSDDFTRNLLTLRGEARLALACYSPDSVYLVDVDADSSSF